MFDEGGFHPTDERGVRPAWIQKQLVNGNIPWVYINTALWCCLDIREPSIRSNVTFRRHRWIGLWHD